MYGFYVTIHHVVRYSLRRDSGPGSGVGTWSPGGPVTFAPAGRLLGRVHFHREGTFWTKKKHVSVAVADFLGVLKPRREVAIPREVVKGGIGNAHPLRLPGGSCPSEVLFPVNTFLGGYPSRWEVVTELWGRNPFHRLTGGG